MYVTYDLTLKTILALSEVSVLEGNSIANAGEINVDVSLIDDIDNWKVNDTEDDIVEKSPTEKDAMADAVKTEESKFANMEAPTKALVEVFLEELNAVRIASSLSTYTQADIEAKIKAKL